MKVRSPRVLSLDEAVQITATLRQKASSIVFTNGCYDLFHFGHLYSLEFAKSQGDVLFVAVNDDDSVRRLKGDSRPILNLTMRVELLAALRSVDYVLSFSEDTALEVIRRLQPEVYVKDSSYRVEDTEEGKEVARYGGRICTFNRLPNLSTTSIVKNICSKCRKDEGGQV